MVCRPCAVKDNSTIQHRLPAWQCKGGPCRRTITVPTSRRSLPVCTSLCVCVAGDHKQTLYKQLCLQTDVYKDVAIALCTTSQPPATVAGGLRGIHAHTVACNYGCHGQTHTHAGTLSGQPAALAGGSRAHTAACRSSRRLAGAFAAKGTPLAVMMWLQGCWCQSWLLYDRTMGQGGDGGWVACIAITGSTVLAAACMWADTVKP